MYKVCWWCWCILTCWLIDHSHRTWWPTYQHFIACNRPKPTDANFQRVTSYKSVMTLHKVVSFISFYKNIEEETESTASVRVSVRYSKGTASCHAGYHHDVRCREFVSSALRRWTRPRRTAATGRSVGQWRARHHLSRLDESRVDESRVDGRSTAMDACRSMGLISFYDCLFILCYSIRFYISMIRMICMKWFALFGASDE